MLRSVGGLRPSLWLGGGQGEAGVGRWNRLLPPGGDRGLDSLLMSLVLPGALDTLCSSWGHCVAGGLGSPTVSGREVEWAGADVCQAALSLLPCRHERASPGVVRLCPLIVLRLQPLRSSVQGGWKSKRPSPSAFLFLPFRNLKICTVFEKNAN